MTQDQQQKNTAPRDPNREHMTLSELWQLWRDNLMSWRSFCDEHHDLFTLNIQAGVRRLGQWLSNLRGSARTLAAANRDRRFPESEYGTAQLFLFFRSSLERFAAAVREHFSDRRKIFIRLGDKRRRFFEEIKLHPAIFLSSAVVIAAAATVLSLYTLGAEVSYDGQSLGVVSSRHAAEKVVAELEDITRQTTGDSAYAVDTAELAVETGVYPRRELLSHDEFQEELGDALGQVEYAYVLYVDGEKIVATTRSGALEDLLEQLKLSYETSDTVNAYFVEDVEIRQEYVESSYVMNLGYIAEKLNETKEGEVTYTVTAGDSYYSIAADYDMSMEDLMKLNEGYDPKILRVGDVLTISNAVPYLTVVNVERQRYVQDVRGDGAGGGGQRHPVPAHNGAAAAGHQGAPHMVSHRQLQLAVQRRADQSVRLPQSAGQHLPQRHRYRQQLRHVHLRLRRRHGDVLWLDGRLRIPDHHRPRQRLSDLLRP